MGSIDYTNPLQMMDSGSEPEPMVGSDLDGSFSDYDDDDDENAYFSSGDEEKEDMDEKSRIDSEGKTLYLFP